MPNIINGHGIMKYKIANNRLFINNAGIKVIYMTITNDIITNNKNK